MTTPEQKPRRLMLVDESAFAFNTGDRDLNIRNGHLMMFLDAARHDFDIVLATREAPDVLRSRLEGTDLSEALNKEYRCDQGFLSQDVHNWDDIDMPHVDVVLTANPDCLSYLASYDFALHPDQTVMPYWRFMETYEDNLQSIRFHNGMAELSASIASSQARINNSLSRLYPDVESVWNKVAARPEIVSLMEAFSRAEQFSWKEQHPQDDVLRDLRHYFEYAASAMKDMARNMRAARRGLANHFKLNRLDASYISPIDQARAAGAHNLMDAFDRYRWAPLTPAHRSLLNNALRAVHDVIRHEPRQG